MDYEPPDKSAEKIIVRTDPKGADIHHMPIPHRSFVTARGGAEGHPDDSGDGPESRSSILPPAKHTVIKPSDDFKVDSPKNEEKPPASPKFMDTKPPVRKAVSPEPSEAKSASLTPETPAPLDSTATKDTQKSSGVPLVDQEKHQQELEDIIESHRYFVPVDAVVRRRTVKINLGLTFVVLVLAFALIDLMLDSGMILLVQRIPHTHFFSLGSTR